MRFACFFSGGFITFIVVNPPERRLTKRTSVQWVRKYEFYEMIFLHIFQDHTTLFGLFLERFSPTKQSIIGLQLSVFTIELVSKELNHFGVIADLFWQIGGHSSRFVLFCSF